MNGTLLTQRSRLGNTSWNFLVHCKTIIIQRMSGEKTQTKAAANKQGKGREEMLQAKRQIRILKEALIAERNSNQALEQQLYNHNERAKKMELQSKRREQKNEGLLLQIRSLKDALVAERSEKQVKVWLNSKFPKNYRDQMRLNRAALGLAVCLGFEGCSSDDRQYMNQKAHVVVV